MIDLIIQLMASAILLIFGYLIGTKGKINLIHSYHYKYVKEEDKQMYTYMVGRALSVLAWGIAIGAYFNYVTDTNDSFVGIFGCVVYTFYEIWKAQKIYNQGKWF